MVHRKRIAARVGQQQQVVELTGKELEDRKKEEAEVRAARLKYEQEEKYKDDRKFNYNGEGATIDNLIVALWEKIVENDSTLADELQTKRLAIKAQFPKPEA